ncbi:hypothetical protein AbraIFM66950_006533 [Aspergillus brasiliensis]|nr:hypothetical protein AbraIFM66950_006533 [Aspergillus brasiliensis]
MDPNYTTIDPHGDMLLVVEKGGERIYTRLSQFNGKHQSSRSIPNYFQGIVETVSKFPRRSSAPSAPQRELIRPIQGLQVQANSNRDSQTRTVQAKLRVSSKHLAFASRFFKRKLDSEDKLKEDDILPARFDHLTAMSLLLHAIHGRGQQIPRRIGPNTLCMIAALTEVWECENAMTLFSETWIMNIHDEIPKVYDNDVVMWIYIAWAFHHRTLFWYITRLAIRGSTGMIQELGLPIPKKLLEQIDEIRQKHVDTITNSLYQRLESVLDQGGCCRACDAMVVGQWMLEMKPKDLFPPPCAPYEGWSVDRLLQTLSEVAEPQCTRLFHASMGCSVQPCALMPETSQLCKQADVEATGLNFDDCVFKLTGVKPG